MESVELCRRKSVNEENRTQNYADAEHRLDSISLSASYKASIICYSVIFASNIVRIFLLLQHKKCHCRSMILVLAPETQAISSVIVLVAVSNFQKSRTMKLTNMVDMYFSPISYLHCSRYTLQYSIYRITRYIRMYRHAEFTCMHIFICYCDRRKTRH